KFYLLRLDDVLYVHSEGTSVLVETVSGTYSAVQPSLRHLEEYLEPLGFFRVSRHHLVNLRHVREIIPMFNRTYRLVLDDPRGTRLDVSRRRSSLLRLALGF
ncbi:MAG: LytTR family transcriptional regulator, partial [Clostridia bacterium]|nr:LytTR family transcriptional regulator [Clostridia bacterium]